MDLHPAVKIFFVALILHINGLMLVNRSFFKTFLLPFFESGISGLSVNGGKDAVF
jgi:hypothetical protein